MTERQCGTCSHRKENGCESWECHYEEQMRKPREFKSLIELADDRLIDRGHTVAELQIELWNEIQELKQDIASLTELLEETENETDDGR